jgi:hypothetical protein
VLLYLRPSTWLDYMLASKYLGYPGAYYILVSRSASASSNGRLGLVLVAVDIRFSAMENWQEWQSMLCNTGGLIKDRGSSPRAWRGWVRRLWGAARAGLGYGYGMPMAVLEVQLVAGLLLEAKVLSYLVKYHQCRLDNRRRESFPTKAESIPLLGLSMYEEHRGNMGRTHGENQVFFC